uniref:LRAT domain-containing protein n=1 Tax=Panagrellus redivivus TaxID=6233 RepID=A0A7E5A190_PANRE
MDIESCQHRDFQKYAESVVGSHEWKAASYRIYGVTQLGQRFVLMLIFKWYYYVYQVVQPHEDSIRIKPMREFATFENEESAKEYMENRQKMLQLHNEIYGLNYFDMFVAEKLKVIWGHEVYRIRDFDVDGNPFVVVLKKNFAYYSVVVFKDPSVEPQISITKCFLEHKADKCVQIELNKLKEAAEKVQILWYVDTIEFKNEEIEEQPLINDVSNAIEGTSDFIAFVDSSLLCSFRGEEVYRKYGLTAAGQQFCFVVSKIHYYIIHVVLEPNSRPQDVLPHKIKIHSRTIHLINIKKRTDADRYVAKMIKRAVNRNEVFIDDWTVEKYHYEIQASSINDLQRELRRGDHIRRNLKVGRFKPTFHDGIYLGNGQVAHYTTDNRSGFFNSKGGSGAGIVSLETFLNGEDKITVSFYLSPTRSGDLIARIAEYLIENSFWDKSYNLVSRNCQLFALLCTTTKLEHQLQQDSDFEMILRSFTIAIFPLGVSLVLLSLWWINGTGVAGLVWTFFIISVLWFISFGIIIGIWCLQRKSVKETMKLFTELENQLELGLFTQQEV